VSESDYKHHRDDGKGFGITSKSITFLDYIKERLRVKSWESKDNALPRKSFYELESQVFSNPLLLSGIHMYQTACQELIDPTKIHIDDKKLSEQFFKEIYPENRSHFQQVFLRMAPFHQGIFGNTLIELVKGGKSKNIKDFLVMDIRQYELIRDPNSQRGYRDVMTKNGRPVGITDEKTREEKYLFGKDCLWSPFIQIHNTEWAWGWGELLYNNTKQILAIQDARTQRAFRQGYPVPIVQYGNERIPSTNKRKGEAKKVAEQIVNPNSVAAVYPEYMKIEFMDNMLPTNTGKSIYEDEMAGRRIEAAMIGLPLPIYLMTMEDQPSRGLDVLSEFYEIRLKSFVRSLGMEAAISAWTGRPEVEVWINYDEILTASAKEKIMQIFRMAKAEVLYGKDEEENEKIRRKLLEMIGLETHDELVDKAEKLMEVN